MKIKNAATIALAGIMIAVTAVFTIVVRVPIPATQGYFNFSDVAVFFSGFSFGPVLGLVAGGIGTAIADIMVGAPQWAVLTFLAHGLQGLVAGLLARKGGLAALIVAWLAGAATMMGVYFVGEGLVLTGWPAAVSELPANLLQNVVGGVVGIPLYYAVRKAYPPIVRMGRPTEWEED